MTRRSRSRWFARVAAVVVGGGVLSSSLAASAGEAPRRAAGPERTPDPAVQRILEEKGDRFRVELRSRALAPRPGVDERGIVGQSRNALDGRVHFLIQLNDIPRAEKRAELERQGLRLLDYVGGNTYVGSAPADVVSALSAFPEVRWAGPLAVGDKIPVAVGQDKVGAWARGAKGRLVLAVTMHPDVAMADASRLIEQLGGTILSKAPAASIVVASFPPGRAKQVATADPVQFVDAVEPRLKNKNATARATANVAPAAAAPYNLRGSGVIGLVFDAGVIAAGHPDFSGRVLETEAGEPVGDHATHVAGTFAGSGANSAAQGGAANQWAGYAPAARIRSFGFSSGADVLYDDAGDTNADLTTAMQSTTGGAKGIDLATASLGDTATPTRGCGVLGDYVNSSILIDKIVRGAINDADGKPQPLIWTFAAGNERVRFSGGASDPIPCGDYVTLSSPAPAKNTITVGAVNSDGGTVTSFSSWGPTSDGRLKPDISAPGCSTTGTAIVSTTSTAPGGYIQKCGTSMATPGVAGAAALVIEQWRKNHSTVRPLPHTMKAILAHTAAAPATFASLVTGAAGSNNQIMYTARQTGAAATIEYLNPGAPSTITTTVTGTAISVSLGTDATGAIVSTAQDVVDEVNANALDATGTRLVSAARGFAGDYTKPFGGNTGAGVVAAMPATALAGGGPAGGPDYRYGWGMVDVGAAVKLVDEDAGGESIRIDTVDQGDVKSIKVFSDGTTDFRATLAWDDVAGTRLPSKALVNDIDLRVFDPSGVEYKPLVLDPQRPRDAATPADDARNNVEMAVGVKKPGIWEVKVTGTIVPQGPQQYTLIAPPPGNGVTVTPSVTTEGDSGNRKASFVVALAHADLKPVTLTYATLGLTAFGTDYIPTNGTLTFAPGEIEKLVEVEIKGDIDDESDERFDLEVSYQGAGPIATGIATIVDDDGDRTFTIVGKTGDASGGLTLAGIQYATVNINDKGKVVFVGRTTTNPYGQMGLWTGKSGEAPVLVNPSWASNDRRIFDYPTIRNDGSIIAYDRQSGSPPYWFVREWTAPLLFGGWNQSVLAESGGQFDSVITPSASLENGRLTFVSLVGGSAYVQWGTEGADGTWGNVQAPLPVIANDGSTIFRQVSKDGNGLLDYLNAPLRIVNVYGSGSGQVTCSGTSGCPHPNFTNIGWQPAISQDGGIAAFYGEQAVQGGTPETGIWASIRRPTGGRTLVRVAKVGDAGITGFADGDQDERLGVNATQDDRKQVTVVFRATSGGGRMALYRARVVYEGPVGAPTGFRVEGPTLIVRQGETINGLGPLDSFSIGDHPINNRNEGDVAFLATSGAVEAAVVAEAADAPVLFVPGIAGTELYDIARSESVWLWSPNFLSRDTYWGSALSMREEDQSGREIVPTDALRQAVNFGVFGLTAGDIYKPLFDKLAGAGYKEYLMGPRGANIRTCDTAQLQARPNLFIFPYDWRRSNAVNAALLKNYMACVKRFYPETKVNVLTHSMGGLLARRTIISQPGFADEVNTLFSVAPPWLGAPKLIYVLRSGDFIPTLASGSGVKRAAAALPGAHQLMPSATYFTLAGTPYGEVGRDFDKDGNDGTIYATFDAVKTLLDKTYPRFKPGSTAAAFHGFAGQDDWRADTYPLKFVEIYGEQTAAKTIGGVYETTKVICEQAAQNVPGAADPAATCSTSNPMMLTWTKGDGTVPTVSAARTTAMEPPDAQIIPFLQSVNGGSDANYDHNGILGNDNVLQRIVEVLAENGGPPDPNAPAPLAAPEAPTGPEAPAPSSLKLSSTEEPMDPSVETLESAAAVTAVETPAPISSIAVYGATAFVAKDGVGNTTEPTELPDGRATIGALPGVDVYSIDENARLLRSTTSDSLTMTFESAGPVEVEIRTEDAAGTVTEATRYLDVGIPDGTPVELTTQPNAAPALRLDANGDGTYESAVAVDVQLTGAAAADVTPPAVDVQRSLADDDMLDVVINATDAGSGLRSVLYTLDGSSFEPYTGPFRVDPTSDLRLSAIAQDNAGNRRATDEVSVGKSVAAGPLAEPVSVSTAEDTPVNIDLPGVSAGNETLRYKVKSAPERGTVTITGNRARYTPAEDFNGVDTFTYVIDDGLLRSAPGTVTITVDAVNDGPRVTVVGSTAVAEGAANVAYRAQAVDPEGDQVTFVWSVAGAAIEPAVADAYLTVGDGPSTATITVEAMDTQGAKTTTQLVVAIQNVAPTAFPGGPRSGPWGLPILFSGLVTDPSSADTSAGFTRRWSFGDATADALGSDVSHVYASPGSYTATFRATDKDGATGSAPSAVSVLKRNTTLAYTGSAGTVPYGYAQLSAKLADAVSAGTAKLSGKRITFTVGLQALTATTDATGAATVVLASPLGPGTYTVSTRFTGDTMYNGSSAASASLKVASSVGSVTGSQLVSLSNGARASFNVSSMDGTTVRGTLEYLVGATTIRSTSLAPMGIASDGRSSWFAGVSTIGQQLRAYVEDGGVGPGPDRFKFWVNGVLQNGDGRLSAGEVSIARP